MMDALELRTLRCFDGLHHSFHLLEYFYSDLYERCCKINSDNAHAIPALAGCWGFIDSLHHIRELARALPKVSHKHPEMRAFLTSTALAEEYRHYIQHLRAELVKEPPNGFPVWGALSWVDPENDSKCHVALWGAVIKGVGYTTCVYDTVNRVWVSKVCLGVDQRSFNFDPIFAATMRFREFIVPHILNRASNVIRRHETLPIVSMEVCLDPQGSARPKI